MRPPDDLHWLATTIFQEAGGESYLGKLAVAHVIMNRKKDSNSTVASIVLSPFQFSAWNTDSPTRALLGKINSDSISWIDSFKAACSAYFGFEPDPSKGARFYLNPVTVLKVVGKLPKWAANPKDLTKLDEAKVTAKIGNHVFIR